MSQPMLGCEYIANMFKRYGVTHVFNIEAMLRMTIREMEKLGIKTVMAHSENAAGYMADGYARVSKRPGICMAQSIGAANMAGGIHDAFLAATPVIAMTGKKLPQFQYKNAYQESDHRLIYEAITKLNAEITEPEQLPFILRQCFREATTGKARPIHLDIPNHMGRTIEAAEIGAPLLDDPEYKSFPAIRPAAPEEAVKRAVEVLENAEKPILVVGRGTAISGAGAEILELARRNDIPVVTTPDGKTVIDEADPLWSGIVGLYGMACANRSVAQADLVIFIGTQASDQTTCDWRVPLPGTQVIQIDIDPAELGKNYPGSIGLFGDAKTVAAQLARAVTEKKRAAWRDQAALHLRETMQAYRQRIEAEHPMIRPERLCDEVGKHLPDNAILLSDTGFSAVWTSTFLKMNASQSYYRAAGSLGWAFPASIGAKCAEPERPVFCFIGDGGLYYHIAEMETAVRNGIQTITIVNNNNVLAQCSGDIKGVYRGMPDAAQQRFTFSDVQLCKVAESLGGCGIRVTRAEEIGPAIRQALAGSKPTLIEVVTDGSIVVPPAN